MHSLTHEDALQRVERPVTLGRVVIELDEVAAKEAIMKDEDSYGKGFVNMVVEMVSEISI